MKKVDLTLPQLALIAGTRGMLGAGIAFLLSNSMSREKRKTFGWSLFLIGALSTIPLAVDVLGRLRKRGEIGGLEESGAE